MRLKFSGSYKQECKSWCLSMRSIGGSFDTKLWPVLAVIMLQLVAVVYFIADAVNEHAAQANTAALALSVFDVLVGCALLCGIGYSAITFHRMTFEARHQNELLAIARGALGALIQQRFASWGLSRGEAEVALFALKGCTIAEIAAMRGSANGTVRSQLSQVYAKAGVSGQPMLMSLFLDDLLDEGALAGR